MADPLRERLRPHRVPARAERGRLSLEERWRDRLEPSDWNLWKRMARIGVRSGFLDTITYVNYLGAVRRASEWGEVS